MIIRIASDLDRVGIRLGELAAALPRMVDDALPAWAEAGRAVFQPVLMEHTPVGQSDTAGALRQSTHADLAIEDRVAALDFKQDAESTPNQDGSGGGHHYVQWVVGGRGPIAPDPATGTFTGPYATGKRALTLTGLGIIRRSVGPAAPNPYPERAASEAFVPIAEALTESVAVSLAGVVRVLL